MPHLKFHGRLWNFGSDDFPLSLGCALILRVIWIACVIIILSISSNHQCEGTILYLSISLAVYFLTFLCDFIICQISMQGTIVESEFRAKKLSPFLYLHFFLRICQLVLSITGIIAILSPSRLPCGNDLMAQRLNNILISFVVISQLIDAFFTFFCSYLWSAGRPEDHLDTNSDSALELWRSRCETTCKAAQICTCNVLGGSGVGSDIEKVAQVLTNFFHDSGFLDVVMSDVVAGLMLLSIEQHSLSRKEKILHRIPIFVELCSALNEKGLVLLQHQQQTQLENISLSLPNPTSTIASRYPSSSPSSNSSDLTMSLSSSSHISSISTSHSQLSLDPALSSLLWPKERPLDPNSLADCMLLKDLSRYSVYALAAYTYLMFIYMHPCSAPCRLSCLGGACCCLCSHACFSTPPSPLMSPPSYHPSSPTPSSSLDLEESRRERSTDAPVSSPSPSPDHFPTHFSPLYDADNLCHSHRSALGLMTKDLKCRLVYASFRNDLTLKPFAIYLDGDGTTPSTSSSGSSSSQDLDAVVIAIRGTLSLEDALTDSTAHPEELTLAGQRWGFDGRGRWAHGGMIRAAMRIREEIASSGILERLGTASKLNGNIGRPLILSGHSLGAAVVSLLGLLLRDRFPSVRVFGYGVPGGTVDATTAQETREFMISTVLDLDIVARLSLQSVIHLREAILDSLVRARVSKAEVIRTVLHRMGQNRSRSSLSPQLLTHRPSPLSPPMNNNNKNNNNKTTTNNHKKQENDLETCGMNVEGNPPLPLDEHISLLELEDDPEPFYSSSLFHHLFYPSDQIPPSQFRDNVQAFKDRMRSQLKPNAQTLLFPPGRLIHIHKLPPPPSKSCFSSSACCSSSASSSPPSPPFQAVEALAPLLHFNEIELSPFMLIDHLPDRYTDALKSLSSQFSL